MSVVDISKCQILCSEVLESVITLANYRVCGAQNRLLTRWFLGESVTVEEWFKTQSVNPLSYMDEEEMAIAIKTMTKKLSNQKCIKII